MGYIFGCGGTDEKESTIKSIGSSILIPAQTFVSALLIQSVQNQHVKIGTTAGGNEIFEDDVAANTDYEDGIDQYFKTATILFITGSVTGIPVIVTCYTL